MSVSTTQSVVRKQLCAMGCELFEIGVLRMDGRMLLRSGWSADQIDAALAWLRRENARGSQIFVRPHGAHALSLVDDLSAETLTRMMDSGFQPAVVVETSLDNFQVWLKHGQILSDRTFSTKVAKELARRFGGDPSSADWRHFGRLGGFTNQKPKRRLCSGLPPFVRLRQWEGRVYDAAEEFLRELKSLAEQAVSERASRVTSRPTANGNPVPSLSEFHHSARYDGDLHRADMAWALHAASLGLSEQQIRDEILHARDLSKKGRIQRQVNYAERTAIKAVTTVQPLR